jgi:hypothetical protein
MPMSVSLVWVDQKPWTRRALVIPRNPEQSLNRIVVEIIFEDTKGVIHQFYSSYREAMKDFHDFSEGRFTVEDLRKPYGWGQIFGMPFVIAHPRSIVTFY